MGGPKGVNNIPGQDQSRPLLILLWIEDDLSLAIIVVACARVGSLNLYRSTELLCTGSKVKRVQPLKIRSDVLGHRYHIDGAVQTRGQIDNRRSRDSDFRDNLITGERI